MVWLAVLIASIVVVAGGLVWLGSKHPQNKAAPIKNIGVVDNQLGGQIKLKDDNQKPVYAYNGVVLEIKPDRIIFLAKAVTNLGLDKDSKIVAMVNKNTQYVRISKPKTLPKDIKPGQSGSLFKREAIGLADIQPGDKITAIASENIRGQLVFTAKRVQVTSVR